MESPNLSFAEEFNALKVAAHVFDEVRAVVSLRFHVCRSKVLINTNPAAFLEKIYELADVDPGEA